MGFEPFIGNLGQLEINKKAQYYLHRYKDIFSVFNKINAKEKEKNIIYTDITTVSLI